MVPPFLLATRSEGKLRELMPLFRSRGLSAVTLSDVGAQESPEEEGIEVWESFEENALAKARYFSRLCGMPTIADDSGLCVEALGGEPGVRSRRWSGRADLHGRELDEANNRHLLERLRGSGAREASYVCVAAFVDSQREFTARGECHGRIIELPRGQNGFGYDPYFFSAELGRTFGEASREEKEEISHRGRAFRRLLDMLGTQ
jgi:XTP/dITP diphosphohydrolase